MPKRKLSTFQIILESIILLIFVRLMFNIGYFTGIFYLVAIGYALWRRVLFTKKNVSWMIIGGTFLSYFAGLFIPYIVDNYMAGNIASAIVIFVLFIIIWLKSRRLKRGKK